MFYSEPICILQAGNTVDGRFIEQSVIDDIADTYNQDVYNARINEEHWEYSYKFGSVVSVEKRDNQLWAVVKPNSLMLRTLEGGQLLHTSCEIKKNFAESGKAYLTGLALTDNPASLGNTELKLSSKGDENTMYLSSGQTMQWSDFDDSELTPSETKLFSKLRDFLFNSKKEPKEKFSQSTTTQDEFSEDEEVNEEVKELLNTNTQALNSLLEAVTKLSEKMDTSTEQPVPETPETPETEGEAKLSEQVESLSQQLSELTEKFSQITDEPGRKLATGNDAVDYL